MIADLTISDATAIISAIVTGIVTIVGAIVAAVVTLRSGQKASDEKRATNKAETDKTLATIHDATNGNWTKAMDKITALEQAIQVKDALAVKVAEEKK